MVLGGGGGWVLSVGDCMKGTKGMKGVEDRVRALGEL